MLLLFFSVGVKQIFTPDTLMCALPNALSSHQHHKPSGAAYAICSVPLNPVPLPQDFEASPR